MMSIRMVTAIALVCLSLATASIAAQQPSPQQDKPVMVDVDARSGRPSNRAPVNVRIEVTIADQDAAEAMPAGAAGEVGRSAAAKTAATKKVVVLTLANDAHGSMRSQGHEARFRVNVDARATIVEQTNGIHLQLGIEYNPRSESPGSPPASLSEQIAVYLESGKPLVISQSADPVSGRKIAVEVKATILK